MILKFQANWPDDKHINCTINNDILTNKTTSEHTLPIFLNDTRFDETVISSSDTKRIYVTV